MLSPSTNRCCTKPCALPRPAQLPRTSLHVVCPQHVKLPPAYALPLPAATAACVSLACSSCPGLLQERTLCATERYLPAQYLAIKAAVLKQQEQRGRVPRAEILRLPFQVDAQRMQRCVAVCFCPGGGWGCWLTYVVSELCTLLCVSGFAKSIVAWPSLGTLVSERQCCAHVQGGMRCD